MVEQVEGRIITEHKASYVVRSGDALVEAAVRGSFHESEEAMYPKVGDYVLLTLLEDEKGVIEEIKERRSVLTRKSAHDGSEQIMVANVDYVFIVMGLDDDFNLRRLERYLMLADQANVSAVIILNKADVAIAKEIQHRQVEETAPGVPIHIACALTGIGMEVFEQYLTNDKTGVLLGSSGVGKSTITNYLLEHAAQETQETRERDGRGRHTTTHRELFALDSGGFLIDTPGMRELGFVAEEDVVSGSFADIDLLALDCQYNNCDHDKSTGCAIKAAVDAGELDVSRFESYRKLQSRKADTRPERRRRR